MFYLLNSKQSMDADPERTREELLPEERDPEQRSKELEGPQQLIGSTGARAENNFAHNRGGGRNQPADTWETVGRQRDRNHLPPVGAEPLQRGLTRSPSPVSSHAPPYIRPTGSPQESPRTAKPRGWIRRLSMPVLSSLDGSKKTDSPPYNDSPRAWRSSLALPETKLQHRKTSLDTPGSKSNQRR